MSLYQIQSDLGHAEGRQPQKPQKETRAACASPATVVSHQLQQHHNRQCCWNDTYCPPAPHVSYAAGC